MDITKEQLDELIFSIKEEYAALAKAEEGMSPKEESSEEASKPAEESKEGAEVSGEEKSEMKKDDAMAKEEVPAEAAPEEAPAEAEPAEEKDLGVDDLYGMYMQLSEEHLAMHYMAASKALYSKMNEGETESEAAPEEVAPEVPAEAAPETPVSEKAPPFGKSNVESDELLKSLNQENATLKTHVNALEAKLDEVVGTLSKVTSQPNRKAYGTDNFNAPVEVQEKVLSKSEIIAELNNKARDPNLTVVDREQLIKFSMKPVLSDELKKFLDKK